jgi:hypothetical protein
MPVLIIAPLILLSMQAGPTIGDHFYGHAMGISDTVDLTLRPAKTPDCETEAQIREALAERARHHAQSCILPKSREPAKTTRRPSP